ncbi:MAG: apolipoprotein N-acyltransferase [Candidatus Acidiferrales bacterium]
MNLPRYARVLLALGSGAALGFAFPNYNLTLLAWISLAMLVLASVDAPVRQAPLYGFLHGQIFYPVVLPWVDTVMRQYGNISPWVSAAFVAAIGTLGGSVCMLFSTGIAIASRRSKLLACVLAPFLWTAVEYFRTNLWIFGSSWDLSGYPLTKNLAFLQLASVTGIYGLCFVVAAYGSLLAYAVMVRSKRNWFIVGAVTAALIFIGLIGARLVPLAQPQYVAHLVQTNFPQSESYPADWMTIHAGDLKQLADISVDAAKAKPGLIIWPEVPAPFSLTDPTFARFAAGVAQQSGNYFLVGVVDWKQDPNGKWLASNTAALLDPTGRRIFSYDKIHLLPFGEYVPLRGWLTFAKRLTADISDFTPGTIESVGQLPQGKFGAFICYEAIFPSEVRMFTANGAQFLITISNDGWFGRSSAPEQHMMMARVRAVENRRWLLRDTNNGYTESIDPYGRTVAQLALDIRGQLNAPYGVRSDLTPYVRFGDWFSFLSMFVAAALILFALLKPHDGSAREVAVAARNSRRK